MGKRVSYHRRSRRRPTRKQTNQRRKAQNRHSRRRQRGGVNDALPTTHTLDGMPLAGGAVVSKGGVVMTVPEFIYRQQDGGDSFLD